MAISGNIKSKEEAKQYLMNQIDSSIKIQSKYNKYIFYLWYNNSYLRALKFSKITGQPVNKNDFKGGEELFGFNSIFKEFYYYGKINVYLRENYSTVYSERNKLMVEVLNEYEEYKGYNAYNAYKAW